MCRRSARGTGARRGGVVRRVESRCIVLKGALIYVAQTSVGLATHDERNASLITDDRQEKVKRRFKSGRVQPFDFSCRFVHWR
jgi:hypothetical protein